MDAQGTMRLMFDTMDAYDRGDFDRLGEIYAKDARWANADPEGPHCRDRDDIFAMFRAWSRRWPASTATWPPAPSSKPCWPTRSAIQPPPTLPQDPVPPWHPRAKCAEGALKPGRHRQPASVAAAIP